MDLFRAWIFLKKPDPDPDLTVLYQSFRYNTYSPHIACLGMNRVPK
jgi:hypothetical protein